MAGTSTGESDAQRHDVTTMRVDASQVRPPPPPPRSRWRIVRIVALVVLLLVAVPLAIVHAVLAASLPGLDGSVDVAGLTAPVTISRDALGIPTIEASNRVDLAYGTGFAHAQDRFFQMDLSRRLAAGELSELFGSVALKQDAKARIFRFRAIARVVRDAAPPEHKAIVEAYTRGVNAGLANLASRPWEYWVLQAKPQPWSVEDTVLVSYAMWWDLQYTGFRREMVKRAINLHLGGADCGGGWKCALTFFYPRGTIWDGPNSAAAGVRAGAAGSSDSAPSDAARIRIPTPEELNVRGAPDMLGRTAAALPREPAAGSNGWVVAGALTDTGSALVASDMHLNLRVPATWYRARLRIGRGGAANGADAATPAEPLDLNGLTLPGAPAMVAGSNGHIAWSFTNSYGDWTDVTYVPCVAIDNTSLRTASETIPLTSVTETLHVKGAADVALTVQTGPAGVLFDAQPARGRCFFARWLATVPAATNLNIVALETATTTAQAIALAPSIGVPHQNFMIGDRAGHIGWSILGRIPDMSATTADRLSGEAPWTTAATHPKLIDPPAGRAWTSNARPIEDPVAEAAIGGDEAALGADYDLGARARQIRDDLMAVKSRATPADMLRIQLDDRALFLTRWRDLLVQLLDAAAVRDQPKRAELKRIVTDWRARASADSVGYRIVRTYRDTTEGAVWEMLLNALEVEAPDAPPPAQFEGALWELVTTRPPQMLAAKYLSWRDFLLAQVDATVAELQSPKARNACPDLTRCVWGARNPVSVRHPLSGALFFAAGLLDMPTLELAGDHDMPRVQDGSFGASERFAVSPGHEIEGYLHIAGGQSGHPLSPYYRTDFAEWAAGKPVPFLPGRAEHELTLAPIAQ